MLPLYSINKIYAIYYVASYRSTYTVSVHDTVIGAATHALILKQWTVANDTQSNREKSLEDVAVYSSAIVQIEKFFAAIRSETPVEVGYSQIVAAPIGWGDSWQAFLPPIYVATVRAYPDHFEKHGWLRMPPTIDENTCKNIAQIFNILTDTSDNRLVLAARRLNTAFLRTNDEDSILDVAVGLEILLASDTRDEITYKLAMRVAALSIIEKFEDLSPVEIFKLCKSIYAYRSSVIHGSKKAERKKVIKLSEKEEISTVRLGVNILRHTIRILSRHIEYLDPEKLDKLLLTNKEQFGN